MYDLNDLEWGGPIEIRRGIALHVIQINMEIMIQESEQQEFHYDYCFLSSIYHYCFIVISDN